MTIEIYQGNNLDIMKSFTDKKFQLIYCDFPFGTNKIQKLHEYQYNDKFDDYKSFIYPLLQESHRLLSDNGSAFFHLDYREVHYVKIWSDEIFGRNNFINEIIWSYDFGGRSKTKWPAKHDNILFYAKNNKNYTFIYNQMDRLPYLTKGGFVTKEKIARGKTPTDVWQTTIVPTNSKEKTGYPNQKPQTILRRIIKVHSTENDNLLDMCAGSGSFGYAAAELNRNCVLIDNNTQAIEIMEKRFKDVTFYR